LIKVVRIVVGLDAQIGGSSLFARNPMVAAEAKVAPRSIFPQTLLCTAIG